MDNNAKVGGILSIIAGAWGICLGIGFPLIAILIFNFLPSVFPTTPGNSVLPQSFFTILTAIYAILGLFYVILGVMSIVGGTFALKRKHWGVALAGSITAALITYLFGIPSVILITMARDRFSS